MSPISSVLITSPTVFSSLQSKKWLVFQEGNLQICSRASTRAGLCSGLPLPSRELCSLFFWVLLARCGESFWGAV